ncbi:MAG: hypothetical protein QXS56_04040, partial [Fervidicoccaceae archaeon]
ITLLILVVIGIFYFALKKNGGEIKTSRFDAGNIPKYDARVKLGLQYLGFFIIFASFEPIVLILLLLSPAAKLYAWNFLSFLLAVVVLSIPFLFFSLKLSEKIDEWLWD